MINVLLLLLGASSGAPSTPSFVPPKTQSLECVGVDEKNKLQKITLESRWIKSEHTEAVFVTTDTLGMFLQGAWLQNFSSVYQDSDRKHGVGLDWQGAILGTVVGDKVFQIYVVEHGVSSASVTMTERRAISGTSSYRYNPYGALRFAGRCSIYISGQLRTLENWPKLGPTL